MNSTITEQIEKLSKNEKLMLVEKIWDSIASDPSEVPIPEHHKQIVDDRLQRLNDEIAGSETWESIRESGF